MIISVNWIKKFVPNLPDIDELSSLIGARLVEIENIVDLSKKYKDVIIAQVVSAEKIKNSDHLSLCKIDDGGVRQGVERDEQGLVQVVCGAPNVREGIFIAWLPPKSIVPETFGGENFELGSRKMLGNISNGMIASIRELDLGDEHDGILEISPEAFRGQLSAGDYFAEKFELNDYLIEVENKSLTHRPDCFGIVGFAREIAGILGQEFVEPDFIIGSEFTTESYEDVDIDIKNSDICDRYTAAIFDVAEILKKPYLTIEKTYLSRSGMRSIDDITDLANRIMLETGQPLHTFDYDKLKSLNNENKVKITVRNAFENEEMELLDGRKIKLTEKDIVIATGANGEIAIALAGAMGGSSTAIDDNTSKIFVESATFNLYNLRNTQMRHGIFSEAITRFTKGVPELVSRKVISLFGEQILAMGAKSISNVFDSGDKFSHIKNKVSLTKQEVNQILGTNFSDDDIQTTLKNVGILADDDLEDTFKIPFWRNDIHIKEDLVEEIGRLNGYDNIDLKLPNRTFRAVKRSKIDKIQSEIRSILSSAGANEILTYTFIHGDLIKKVNQSPENSYKIINSISPDLQFYRQSLTPSLLSKISQNIRGGFDKFAIFEINKISHKKLGLNDERFPVPNEDKKLAFIFTDKKGDNAFYEAKNYANFLFKKLGLNLEFKPFDDLKIENASEFEPKRSSIIANLDGEVIGVLGEFKKSVQKNFKLPESTAGFEIDLLKLCDMWKREDVKFKTISKFQNVERDLSLRVEADKSYAEVLDVFKKEIIKFGKDLQIEISPIDIYRVDDNYKNIALRFTISPLTKTLTGVEITDIMNKISKAADKINAEII